MEELNHNTTMAIFADIKLHSEYCKEHPPKGQKGQEPDDDEPANMDRLRDPATSVPHKVILLKAAANWYKQRWRTLQQQACKQHSERRKRLQQNNTEPTALYGAIKQGSAPPLQRVAEYIDGRKVIQTQPKKVDQILRRAWGAIYAGNIRCAVSVIRKFTAKYDRYLHKAGESHVGDLTGPQLMAEIEAASNSAAGLDGWRSTELSIISGLAAQLLADLLNAIEQDGAPWPDSTLQVRAAFLGKGGDGSNPLDYRVLSIMSVIYRRWASLRHKSLKGWVATWAMSEHYAGTGPNGAEDAWYHTGMVVETARLKNQDITGGAADVWKCSDQVLRELLFVLLKLGGFPSRILAAYKNFHDNCHFYNGGRDTGGTTQAPLRDSPRVPAVDDVHRFSPSALDRSDQAPWSHTPAPCRRCVGNGHRRRP